VTEFTTITSLLETVEDMSPSGFAIGFHLRLISSEFQFQTYPRDWTNIYSEKGYVLTDPSVIWAVQNSGAIRWSDLTYMDDSKIFEQAAQFGIKFGCSIAVGTESSRSIAGLSRPDREFSDAELSELTEHILKLHTLTTTKDGMSEELRSELHRLSVKMTHPS